MGMPSFEESAKDPFAFADWTQLVHRIQDGDPAAMGELYHIFGKGVRYILVRKLGNTDIDDRVHDVFVIVVEAIRNGDLRDPDRLMGFVRTVVKRQIAANITETVNRRHTEVDYQDSAFAVSDAKSDPEHEALGRQREEIVRKVLESIARRDREILYRFYVDEQPMEMIMDQMGLSYNQFRLLKSRALMRFGKLGRRLAAGTALASKKYFGEE
jgi:RNA polymerase sigma factor (sigma-70 family)